MPRSASQILKVQFLLDGKITYINTAASKYLQGWSEELIGKNIYTLLSPKELVDFEIQISRLNLNRPLWLTQLASSLSEKTERIKWSLHLISPLDDSVIEIQAVGRNISGWNQISENLDLTTNIIENSVDGIVVLDHRGFIMTVNRAFSQMTGFSNDDVVGKSISTLQSNQHSTEFYDSIRTAISENGIWQGELREIRKNNENFPAWVSISTLASSSKSPPYYAIYIRDISTIKNMEENLSFIAFHDPLTGLPNRALFHNRLTHAIELARRNQKMVTILFLDLDMFKTVNDTFGHDKGDLLLQEIAYRLGTIIRQSDTVARMGGDEFTLLLEDGNQGSIVGAYSVAKKILQVVSWPYTIDRREIVITPSIGISIFPTDGDDVVTLLKNADLAMYRAKEMGKNNFQFFSPELNVKVHKRLDMENHLRRAQECGELLLVYQPIINAETQKVTAVEALLRWENPDLGKVYPDEFIPLAESSGMILPMGEWVLEHACKKGKAFHDSGFFIKVAINLSGRQLESDSFVQTVEVALDISGFNPEFLSLEITESLLMGNLEKIRKALLYLRSLGIGVSIDDFGTGYSSLNSLVVLPIDTLKIDKSFIADIANNPHNLSLVQGIISIGHNLDLSVIGEGVETKEQAGLLVANQCDGLQGYLYSYPLSESAIMDYLAEHYS